MKTPQQKKFDIFADIAKAINERKQIFIKYKNSDWRLVKPCRLGVSAGEGGAILMNGFQEDGESTSGKKSGWKFFDIEEITAFQFTDKTFEYTDTVDTLGGKRFRRLFATVFSNEEAFI